METDWKHEVPGDLGAGREHPMLMHFPSLPRYNPGKDLEIMFSSQNNQQHCFFCFSVDDCSDSASIIVIRYFRLSALIVIF